MSNIVATHAMQLGCVTVAWRGKGRGGDIYIFAMLLVKHHHECAMVVSLELSRRVP